MIKKEFIEVDLEIVNLESEVILQASGGSKDDFMGTYTEGEWQTWGS